MSSFNFENFFVLKIQTKKKGPIKSNYDYSFFHHSWTQFYSLKQKD